jgi:hypothetical protein
MRVVGPRAPLAAGAIIAPALHTLTDLLEWLDDGFSPVQLWLNYAAFLPLPAILVGLYAVQRPRIAPHGLLGALAYGFSFVYFAHTTLVALENGVPDYATLWAHLGLLYTVHGALMIAGGLAFGWATLRARVFPRWMPLVFLGGLGVNLVVALLPVPEIFQTVGTAVRNLGLIGMGWSLVGAADPGDDR